jgi:hypothetical protein
LANRNFEWHYDGATNTGSCTKNNLKPYKPYEAENDIRAQRIQSLQQINGWTYPFAEKTYNDIREHELKCLADRNREWHYDASSNTGTCTLKSLTPYKPFEPVHDIRAQ